MSLKIWISAFIPKTVTGYTRVLPKGTHVGKTAIPLPTLASLNPVNLWKEIKNFGDTGYLTDQRDFSDSQSAAVRMQSWLDIRVSPLEVINKGHLSSGTTEVDLKAGTELGFKIADMSACTWRFPVNLVQGTKPTSPVFPTPMMPVQAAVPTFLVMELEASAADPLVSAAADIDYEGKFSIRPGATKGALSVEFEGKIDSFPAFEAYASLDGNTKVLFTAPPPAGNTVMSLPGKANRPIKGTVSFP